MALVVQQHEESQALPAHYAGEQRAHRTFYQLGTRRLQEMCIESGLSAPGSIFGGSITGHRD
jgi:hypothetical protein